jgi:hypothetical protein
MYLPTAERIFCTHSSWILLRRFEKLQLAKRNLDSRQILCACRGKALLEQSLYTVIKTRRHFRIFYSNARPAPCVDPLSREISYFCLFERMRSAKIFISRPEGQPRGHSQLLSKKFCILKHCMNHGVWVKCMIKKPDFVGTLWPAWRRSLLAWTWRLLVL